MQSAMWQMRAAFLFLTVLTCCVLWNSAAPSSSSPAPEAGNGDSLRGALEALDRRQRALQHRMRPSGPAGRYRYPALRQRDMHDEEEEEEDMDGEDIEFLPLESGQPEDIGYGFQRGGMPGTQHGGETHISPAQLERMLYEYLDEGGAISGGDDEHWSSPFRVHDDQVVEDEAPTSIFRERQRQEKRTASSTLADERYLQLMTALWDNLEQQQASEDKLDKRQDGYDGYGYDFYNSPMGWGDGHFSGYKRNAENDPWFPAFELVPRKHGGSTSDRSKHFPISKRSSNSVSPHHKKVGPKVKADLADIFEKKSNNSTNSTSTDVTTTTTVKPTHLEMHKKSVDWSQYFGIDRRRKKSSSLPSEPEEPINQTEEENQEETERRLMEQYYRTLALATTVKRKRSDGDSPEQHQEQSSPSLEGMDQKLKAMEDIIVNEAVKFTGAHQGSTDPKEIQNVKEQVLSRLAAAYSLEKMRKALDEFRASLDTNNNDDDDEPDQPEKRRQYDCKELNILASRCSRVQPAITESCTWHHACQQCGGSTEMCNAGFLRSAEQECERRATAEMYNRYAGNLQSMCMRGARRLLVYVEHAGSGIKTSCPLCVRRFLEARRRR